MCKYQPAREHVFLGHFAAPSRSAYEAPPSVANHRAAAQIFTSGDGPSSSQAINLSTFLFPVLATSPADPARSDAARVAGSRRLQIGTAIEESYSIEQFAAVSGVIDPGLAQKLHARVWKPASAGPRVFTPWRLGGAAPCR
jgi:hypothetical protein